jgi:hypothetical protein
MTERFTPFDLDALPGGALIRQGLADLEAGHQSIGTLLIDIARPRLTELGLIPHSAPPPVAEPERELYRRLRAENGDAYARYNSLIRELTSFQSAFIRVRALRRE